ncbi:hypothetical protein EW146_g468 [Bondarzewia mesenterica]|uniref:PRELI/MSF1 domain-containing protein n=1 Tax=Bondarzewia mesenterica TaxID=1095465 RepID=A0A4V3XGD6_9AGAM|nr:hypothetical protein EW146_g468 [Bondarzewia mesenterica]
MTSTDGILPKPSTAIEVIFLGTGTSSSLPHIECLTAGPDDQPCRTCLSTLTPEGKKNVRRNTSAVLRIDGKDGKKRTVVIDVGKNFQAAALEWFPKYGLRRIDAVLITHAHADAMNGLDDLRAWTLRSVIQPHIDVYVSQATFTEVQRSFPYMVAKEFASGGGDVPEFKWRIIDDKVPFHFEDSGIEITPFAVHHGRIFSVAPPPGFVPTPDATLPSTPTTTSGASSPARLQSPGHSVEPLPKIHPYICFGFKIQNSVIYLSDVSHIPDDSWALLEGPTDNGNGDSIPQQPYPVFILDCLRLHPHTSHLGIKDAANIARRLGARRTYLTGFGHEVSHEEYVTIGEVIGGKRVQDMDALTATEKRGINLLDEGKPIWIRPAHDGLKLSVSSAGMLDGGTLELFGLYRVYAGTPLIISPLRHRPPSALSQSKPGSLAMRVFSQSFLYDDPWSIVSLAFFLRYPNPYASHVLSCDVISREFTSNGSLLTTRLILKRGALPRWAPRGIVSRAESWVIEESEVDPEGKVVRCRTRNLDHVKVMQVHETQVFKQTLDGYSIIRFLAWKAEQLTCAPIFRKTLQTTEASIVSGFGWGLTRRIESHGLARFKANMQRSREGVSLILDLIRQARLHPMTMGASYLSPTYPRRHASTAESLGNAGSDASHPDDENELSRQGSMGSRSESHAWYRPSEN